MPSFDVVSEVNMHEVTNAVDQANREVANRFDFKGTNAGFEQKDSEVSMSAESDFQLKQMLDILENKLAKRGVDIACIKVDTPEVSGKEARQKVTLRQGIDTPLAKKMIKMIKDTKLKVQGSIQGEKVRVSGKKRDDLQKIIVLLREAEFEIPLQFVNMRD
ncbi:putative nucleotide-binding protein [bacterium BMS3Abin07]|nr:putative nucleotide-binding protein [bacterium BMS3Abin07]GBE31796.1 putative nucleotide-binding protein [bacterium BMS3Bbin05]